MVNSMRKHWRRTLAVLVALVLVAVVCFWPTGKYVEVPGTATSLKSLVKVDGKKDTAKGHYYLMTVGVVGPASPILLLWGHMQPYSEIDSTQELMGSDSSAEYDLLQNYYIKSAANNATAAAFKAAHRPVRIEHKGIYVMSLLNHSPFKNKLKLGDTITALNGKHYETADDYVTAVKRHHVGDRLTLTYVHKGKTRHATAKLMRLPGTKRAGIGITLTENTSVVTDPKVKINAGDIGGPSAGLMFGLQTYTLVTGQNLRHGQNIAGTGTIDAKGNVGQIGGIDKKVYSANKQGATIFFAPDEPATKAIRAADPTYKNNYSVAKQTAKQIGTKMKIVPVRTLADAINYLNHHA